ncbi:hypothetical protein UFOVP38_60 [uncultured Caudovirales phage]|uniref:Uncharacterized protein n=1 Tax=uncultured Caudovirales phage TaxID=2100421 RepID=A0A6J5T830_9CAUD|nr:hypothetical protein UFOVP38_60 [uncultured Caudovirales phage]
MNKEREALEIALDYVLRTTYWTEGRDRHDTLKAIKEALAQPEQEQDSTCSATLRSQGKPYPRTCKKCGLGPCVAKLVAQSLPYAVKTYHEGRPVYVAQPKQDAGYVCVDGYRHPAAFIYTTPPKREWVGLTDEEFSELSASGLSLWALWRAIAAKLKEKNNV